MAKRLSLQDFNIVKEISLLWGDMDALQHINNIKYFRYFEESRVYYMEKLGFFELMAQTGIGPILAEANCKYILPLTHPDTISVGTRTTTIDNSEFHQEYLIKSWKNDKNAALGSARMVAYNYQQQQRTELPWQIVDKIKQIDNNVELNFQ